MDDRKRVVVIVQEYIPGYRKPFFDALTSILVENNVELRIAADFPHGELKNRNDAISFAGIIPLKHRYIRVGDRRFEYSLSSRAWKNADAVIVDASAASLRNWRVYFLTLFGRMKVGYWGHLKNYVKKDFWIDVKLETLMFRTADHLFAYTPGGREYAISLGIKPTKITTVYNTIDTSSLIANIAALELSEVSKFKKLHGLVDGKTISYIGGLDKAKRIDFLVKFLELLWLHDNQVKLLVGGRGDEEFLLKDSIRRGQVVWLGHALDHEKALIAATSEAIIMPGRIGLVAVDGLVMKLPILTTNFPFHAPESEYLTEGISRFTSAFDSPESFLDLVTNFLSKKHSKTEYHFELSLESMVKNFATGIIQLLSKSDRSA